MAHLKTDDIALVGRKARKVDVVQPEMMAEVLARLVSIFG